MSIPIDIVGRIVSGEDFGNLVRVRDDCQNTGGFLIFTWWDGSDGPNDNGAFDDWVGTRDDLDAYFSESGWQVEWSDRS